MENHAQPFIAMEKGFKKLMKLFLILNGTFVKLSLPLIKHDWPKLSTYPEIPLWASELLKPSPSAKQLHFMMLIMLYLQ